MMKRKAGPYQADNLSPLYVTAFVRAKTGKLAQNKRKVQTQGRYWRVAFYPLTLVF
jgi:hypothetical protein